MFSHGQFITVPAPWDQPGRPGREKTGREPQMDTEREGHAGQVPLPGFGEPIPAGGWVPLPGFSDPAPARGPAPSRSDGIRRVRRTSNWTLAVLIAGTGAATVALAHNAFPGAAASAGTAPAAAAGAAAAANGAAGPQVRHPVATASGSGVVTTTTTKTAGGKVIVTHVRHASYQDN